jgi:hypothetical protein
MISNDFLASHKLSPLLAPGSVSTIRVSYHIEVKLRLTTIQQDNVSTPEMSLTLNLPTLEAAKEAMSSLNTLVIRSVEYPDGLISPDPEAPEATVEASSSWVFGHLGRVGYVEAVLGLYKVLTRRIPLVTEAPPAIGKEDHVR